MAKGDTVGALFIDFRKAFDLVDHNILNNKLSAYKFNNMYHKMFTSYLESRQQAIDSGLGFSSFSTIKSGVPQGSTLGPTLFLLFINDLPLLLKYCFSDLFADDLTIHTKSPDISVVNSEIQTNLGRTSIWGKQNKMTRHCMKTKYMLLGARHRLDDNRELSLYIDDNCIEKVTKQKLLGVFMDENLSWTPHIDHLCSLISTKISLLKQLAEYVPQNVQKLFYQSYILPLFDYGCNTWGTTSSQNIERLSKLQKQAARIILQCEFRTPSATMFQELGWLNISKRLIYNKLF